MFNISYTLVAHKDLPYSSPQDVIAAAKANPGGLKLANAGTGTGQHIMGAAFMKLTGTKFLEVPYRGSAAAFPDLLAGRVDLFVDSTPAALPYIKSGQAKGIGILFVRHGTHLLARIQQSVSKGQADVPRSAGHDDHARFYLALTERTRFQ